jgi:hypothetical protein
MPLWVWLLANGLAGLVLVVLVLDLTPPAAVAGNPTADRISRKPRR